MSNTNAIPEGYHTVTPYLCITGAADAIDFYKKAFDAEEMCRMTGPDGKTVMHGEIRIGDSQIMLGEESPQMPSWKSPNAINATTVQISLYVLDVDKVFEQAISAGATELMKPADMFWGDRYGKVKDPFGHEWGLATHIKDVPPEELQETFDKMFKEGQCG